MVAIASLFAILSTFAYGTLAAPVQAVTPSPNVWVQGQAAPAGSFNGNSSDYDIRKWANKVSKDWKAPTDASAQRQALFRGPSNLPSYLVLDYTQKLQKCTQSAMQVKSLADELACSSSSGCFLSRSLTTTETDQFHLGYKLSISISEEGGGGVPGVAEAKVSASVTNEFSADYTYTNATSTSTSYTFKLQQGETCLPAEVSWTSTCDSEIEIQKFRWLAKDGTVMFPDQLANVDNICTIWQQKPQWLLCGNNDCSGNFDDTFRNEFDIFTQICNGHIPTVTNDLSVTQYGRQLSMIGCIYNNY